MTAEEFKNLKIGDIVYYSHINNSPDIYELTVKDKKYNDNLIIFENMVEFDVTAAFLLYNDKKLCTLNFIKHKIQILETLNEENKIRELKEEYYDFIKENVEHFI